MFVFVYCSNCLLLYKHDLFQFSTVRHLLLEGVRYNDEKERQAQWSTKIKELERIEEAKKKAEEKSKLHVQCESEKIPPSEIF